MADGEKTGFSKWLSNISTQDVGMYGGGLLGGLGLIGSAFSDVPSGYGQGISQMEDYLRQLQGRYSEVDTRRFNPLSDPGMRGVRGQMQSALAQNQSQIQRTLAQRGLSGTGLAGSLARQSGLDYARQLGTQTAQRQTSFEQWKDQLQQSLLGMIGTGTAQLSNMYAQQAQAEAAGSPWSAIAGLGGQLLGSAIGGGIGGGAKAGGVI